MSGATVRLARLQARFGGPTPTKHTRSPSSWRAETTIIVSVGEYAGAVTSPLPRPDDHVTASQQPAAGDAGEPGTVQEPRELVASVQPDVTGFEQPQREVENASE